MGLDNRIKYTKSVINDAFFKLLQDRNVVDITVTDICKLAEINRATFYRYYDNQYDLLESIETEMFDDITKAAIVQSKDINEAVFNVLKLLDANKEKCLLLFGESSGSRLLPRIYKFFASYYKTDSLPPERKLRYSFLLYGFSGIIEDWLKTNCALPYEKLAENLVVLKNDVMKKK